MRCIMCRRAISQALDYDRPLLPWAVKHMAHCHRCAERWNSLRDIADTLTADAPEMTEAFPPHLHAQIMSRIRTTPCNPPRLRHLFPLWAYAVAAMLVIMGWLTFYYRSPEADSERPPGMVVLAQYTDTTVLWISQLGGTVDDPLAREMTFLMNDVNTAGHFLFRCMSQIPSTAKIDEPL